MAQNHLSPLEALASVRGQFEHHRCRIERVRKHDFYAECPVCRDDSNLVHVTIGEKGIVFRCHGWGGCSYEELRDELELRPFELFFQRADVPADPLAGENLPLASSLQPSKSRSATSAQGRVPSAGSETSAGEARATHEEVADNVPDPAAGNNNQFAALGNDLDELFERYRAGDLVPVPVVLDVDRLAPQAHELRRLAEQIALVMGLRLAMFDYGPVPLSERTVARLMGWACRGQPDGKRAWSALNTLEDRGVIVRGPDLEPQPHRPPDWKGARTYLPPEPLASELGFRLATGDAVERDTVPVEVPVVEPAAEVEDQLRVDGAQPTTR